MLILARRIGESIVIDDRITVKVHSIPTRSVARLEVGDTADPFATRTELVRIGKQIRVSDLVTVTVVGIAGRQVKLDIVAPREVSVHREEVAERIRAKLHMESLVAGLYPGCAYGAR